MPIRVASPNTMSTASIFLIFELYFHWYGRMSLHLCCPVQEELLQATGPRQGIVRNAYKIQKAGKLETLVLVAPYCHRIQQYEIYEC